MLILPKEASRMKWKFNYAQALPTCRSLMAQSAVVHQFHRADVSINYKKKCSPSSCCCSIVIMTKILFSSKKHSIPMWCVGGINLNIREGKFASRFYWILIGKCRKAKRFLSEWKVCKQLIKISIIIIIKINISTLSWRKARGSFHSWFSEWNGVIKIGAACSEC